MSKKKCEAAFPILNSTTACPAEYFECTRKDKHRVHAANWTIYANGGLPAQLVLRWKDGPMNGSWNGR